MTVFAKSTPLIPGITISDKIDVIFVDKLERLISAGGFNDLTAGILEQLSSEVANVFAAFDDDRIPPGS